MRFDLLGSLSFVTRLLGLFRKWMFPPRARLKKARSKGKVSVFWGAIHVEWRNDDDHLPNKNN